MVNLTVNGENTTLSIEYTAPTVKINSVLNKALESIYEIYPMCRIPEKNYSDLKIAEKKTVLDNYIKWQLLEMSRLSIEKIENATRIETINSQLDDYKL